MKKGTKVGLTLVGLAGLATAAAIAIKKYKENYYDEDLIDEDEDFMSEYDELEDDFADEGADEYEVKTEDKIVKPAVKIPAKKKSTKKPVNAKTVKKSS